MSVADIESKSLCIHKIEDLVLDPIFTIFWVQHSQVASRSNTDNERLLHFKNSYTPLEFKMAIIDIFWFDFPAL